MNKMRKASVAATTRGVNERSKNVYQNDCSTHLHYITWLSAATTIIASWHITDIWSGVVALLCSMVTIWMVYDYVGGLEDDSEKA